MSWYSLSLILVHSIGLNLEYRRSCPSVSEALLSTIRLIFPIVVFLDDLVNGVLVGVLGNSSVLEVLDLEGAILRLSVNRIEVSLSSSLVNSNKLPSWYVDSPKVSLTRLRRYRLSS